MNLSMCICMHPYIHLVTIIHECTGLNERDQDSCHGVHEDAYNPCIGLDQSTHRRYVLPRFLCVTLIYVHAPAYQVYPIYQPPLAGARHHVSHRSYPRCALPGTCYILST